MTILPIGKNPSQLHSKIPNKVWRVGTLNYTTVGLFILFFWLLWGDFAWSLKERSVPPVLQLLLKKFGSSDTLAGMLIGSLPGVFTIILGPIISYKSDRHRGPLGRRIPFLLVTAPIAALAMLGLAFSPVIGQYLHQGLGSRSPGLDSSILIFFALFWTLFEVSTIIANAVFGALINDVVPQAVLGRFYGAVRALSLIAGMIFFWKFGKAESHAVSILIGIGALYGIGITLMCLKVKEGEYPLPPPQTHQGIGGFLDAARGYFRECFGIPYYWWFFGMIALSWAAFGPVNLFCVFFAKSINMNMDIYGKCVGLSYFISLGLAYPLGSLADRFHPLRVGIVALGLYAMVTLWGGLFARDSWTFEIALVAHGALSGTWLTATASIGQRLLPKPAFARFSSATGIVINLVGIIVSPAVGIFLDYTHHVYRYTFLISSGLAMLALLTSLVLHRKFMALGGPKNYVAPDRT